MTSTAWFAIGFVVGILTAFLLLVIVNPNRDGR